MKNVLKTVTYSALLAGMFAITSCSSGGGGGSKDAEITEENKVALATAGTEGAKQGVNTSGTSGTFGFAKIAQNDTLRSATVSLAQIAAHNPQFASTQLIDCDTGSATFDTDDNTGNGSFNFDSCITLFGNGDFVEYDGIGVFETTQSGNTATSSIEYNITITVSIGGNVETETIDFNATCTTNTDTFATSCTYDSSALGIDGRTYELSGISVTGNSSSGYFVSATVTDPDHGEISITTNQAVTFNCSTGQPDAGEIEVSDGTNTMVITFIDCDSYSINFNGSTTTHSW